MTISWSHRNVFRVGAPEPKRTHHVIADSIAVDLRSCRYDGTREVDPENHWPSEQQAPDRLGQPEAAPHLPFDRIDACRLHSYQHFVGSKCRRRDLANRKIVRFPKVAQHGSAPARWIGRVCHRTSMPHKGLAVAMLGASFTLMWQPPLCLCQGRSCAVATGSDWGLPACGP